MASLESRCKPKTGATTSDIPIETASNTSTNTPVTSIFAANQFQRCGWVKNACPCMPCARSREVDAAA